MSVTIQINDASGLLNDASMTHRISAFPQVMTLCDTYDAFLPQPALYARAHAHAITLKGSNPSHPSYPTPAGRP